jgi:hypothetical protein
VFEGVSGSLKEEAPEGSVNEMEEREDSKRAVWWGGGCG